MDDLISYAFALAVVYAAYKWLSQPKEQPPPAGPSLGFTPKRVTPDMVTQVQAMFPDQPYDNIKYDLLRTGSVELTCNKILEQGFLQPPPQAYFTLYPTQAPVTPAAPARPNDLPSASNPGSSSTKPNLIDRYDLKNRVESEKEPVEPTKSSWATTAEKREANLRERKAQMVLAARQRLLEKEQQSTAS